MTHPRPLPPRTTPAALAAGLLAFATSCSSSGALAEEGELSKPPASGNGYLASVDAGSVAAEARFYTKHAELFGDDLIDEEGVIPIAVKVVLLGERDKVRCPDQRAFRLYLEDGTALPPIACDEIAKDDRELNDRVASVALESGLVRGDGEVERFVYFKLRPADDFEVDGTEIVHRAGGVTRTLDLTRSLLAFLIDRNGANVPIRVGVGRAHAFRK